MTQPHPPDWRGSHAPLPVPPGYEPSIHRLKPPRIVVFNRWAAAVALILGIILMTTAIVTTVWAAGVVAEIGTRLDTPDGGLQPQPDLTGCPWVPTECADE